METPSYKKRRNASVIFFSPQFNEAIRAIRSDLGLPPDGFNYKKEREKWYAIHHTKNTREPYRPLPNYYWYFPKEFIEIIESFAYSSKASKVNYYQDVPLDCRAMELIQKFDLPEEIVNQVKKYILGEEGPLSVGAALQPILIPLEKGTKYMVLVAGIDPSSTQKDWLDVWGKIETIFNLSEVGKIPHKRPIDNLLLRDLKFWKQIKEGKPAREVADEWLKKHPEDKGYPVEDMVRKAAKRIEKIMAPDT